MKENNTWLKRHYRKTLYPVILIFVVLAMVIPMSIPALAAVQQSNTTGDGTTYNVNASTWIAQVFTTGSAYTVGSVRLKLIRTSTYSGTVTASIQQCEEVVPGDGNWHPTGTDLCVGTLDSTSITTMGTGDWYSIGLAASSGGTTNLAANSHYAIVVRATTDSDGTVGWRCNYNQGYSGGLKWISYDSGVSWSGVAEGMMFEVLDTSVSQTYTVTYDGNGNTGGTVPTDSTAYHSGDTVTVLVNTGGLVKTGCDFSGWNTAADGSGTDYIGSDTFPMGTSNVVLYAKWTYQTTVTLTGTKSARAGQNVRLAAVVDVVAGRVNPTGNVTFYYATSQGGSTTQIDSAVTLVRGKAKLTATFQSSGTYYVTASYSGDTGYYPSDSDPSTPLTVTIK